MTCYLEYGQRYMTCLPVSRHWYMTCVTWICSKVRVIFSLKCRGNVYELCTLGVNKDLSRVHMYHLVQGPFLND